MTRSVGAALEAHYQGAVTTIAFCINLVLARWQPRITAITKANPGAVTTRWAHGFATGDSIKIVGVEGMTQVNDTFFTITVTGANTFTLGVDTSAYSTYTAGSWYGTARRALGFTNHVRDLTFSGVVYHSSAGGDGSNISTKADLSLTSRDITAIIDSSLITVVDLERGLYSGAEYETFEVNYSDLTQGRVVLEYGRLGDITVNDQMFVAEGLSLVNILHQNVGPQISVTCRAQLGNRISDTYDERYGCKVRLNPPTWLAATAYTAVQTVDAALGSIVKPTVYNTRHFKCTTAGTSGGGEPAWNTTIGATTADNTVVWTCIDALTKDGAITSVVDTRTLRDSSRVEIPGLYSFGLLTFLTGANVGWNTEVKEFRYTTAPTFQQAGSGVATASVASLTPSYPTTGNAVGDNFWLHVTVRNQTTTVTTPSGWTLVSGPDNIDTVGRSYIFAKASTGSEAGTITVAFGADAAVTKIARIYRIRNGGIAPQSAALLSGSDTTIESASLTSTTGNTLAVAFVSVCDDVSTVSWTGETGGDWTEAVSDFVTALGNDGGVQLQTAALTSPGTIAGGSQTISPAAAWLVQAFILPVASEFVLRDAPPSTMQVGDTYEIEVGCDKIFSTCIAKFANVYNFRGEPYIPGFHKEFMYPDGH